MPILIGFAEQRKRILQLELDRIIDELPQLGIQAAILVGPLAEDKVRPSSNIEIVFIHDTAEPFISRPDFFYNHLQPRVGLDVVVYTPQEYQALRNEYRHIGRVLEKRGILLYDIGH